MILKWILFYLTVGIHLFVVIINILAFFILPFTWLIIEIPFWYSVFLITPIESIIIFLSFAQFTCPSTRLENILRKQLGLPTIGGFIGYYFLSRKK